MVGAAQPMLSNVGMRPTAKVEKPMTTIVMRNVYLRPTRSPMRPKNSAPNGRTRNPAAYAPSAPMSWAEAFTLGKNRPAKNRAKRRGNDDSSHFRLGYDVACAEIFGGSVVCGHGRPLVRVQGLRFTSPS